MNEQPPSSEKDKARQELAVALTNITHLQAEMESVERQIFWHRFVFSPRTEKSALAKLVGISSSQVKQFESKIGESINLAIQDAIPLVKLAIECDLRKLARRERLHEAIDGLLPSSPSPFKTALRRSIIDRLGFKPKSGMYLTQEARGEFLDFQEAFAKLVVKHPSPHSEKNLAALLPSGDWQPHLAWLVKRCKKSNPKQTEQPSAVSAKEFMDRIKNRRRVFDHAQ